MPDVLGYRAKMGVLGPSTNTIVEPDYYMMAPPGVTLHYSRIYIPDGRLSNDDEFVRLMEQIRAHLDQAILAVKTAEPDYLVMGMSSETSGTARRAIGGSPATSRSYRAYPWLPAPRPATARCSSSACVAWRSSPPISRLPTPRYGAISRTAATTSWRCTDCAPRRPWRSPTRPRRPCGRLSRRVNSPDVEAIVQCGTNLSMVRLADAAERELGKPVIAINAATFWYALRACGIADRRAGLRLPAPRSLADHHKSIFCALALANT